MAWPTVGDDVGDKISGSIFNKALTDAMKGYVDDLVIPPAGFAPGETAGTVLAEVIAARGTCPTLDGRLDVSINEGGSLKNVDQNLYQEAGGANPVGAPGLYSLISFTMAAGTLGDNVPTPGSATLHSQMIIELCFIASATGNAIQVNFIVGGANITMYSQNAASEHVLIRAVYTRLAAAGANAGSVAGVAVRTGAAPTSYGFYAAMNVDHQVDNVVTLRIQGVAAADITSRWSRITLSA